MLHQDQAMKPSIYDHYKVYVFITSHCSIKKWIIWVLKKQHQTHFKMLNSWSFIEFVWNPFIEFLHLANFLVIIWYCWNCLTHFSDTCILVLFNQCFQMLVISYGWMSSVILIFEIHIPTTEHLKPAPYHPIRSESFTPCFVDIDIELIEKSKCITSFFIFMIRSKGWRKMCHCICTFWYSLLNWWIKMINYIISY